MSFFYRSASCGASEDDGGSETEVRGWVFIGKAGKGEDYEAYQRREEHIGVGHSDKPIQLLTRQTAHLVPYVEVYAQWHDGRGEVEPSGMRVGRQAHGQG